MPEFSLKVKNRTERGQKQAGREGQAGPVLSWPRSEARGTVTVRAGEGTRREQLVQVFPQTQNSLACFSVNDKNTQWGNVSEKQIHFLLTSLARLHRVGTVICSSTALGRGVLWSESLTPGRGLASPQASSSSAWGGSTGRREGRGGSQAPFLAGIPASCREARAVGQHNPPAAALLLL